MARIAGSPRKVHPEATLTVVRDGKTETLTRTLNRIYPLVREDSTELGKSVSELHIVIHPVSRPTPVKP